MVITTRISRRLLLALLAVSGLLLAATAASVSSSKPAAASGGTLRIASNGEYDSLNVFAAFQIDPFSVFMQIYPMLVQYNRSMKTVPDFATSWRTSADGRTWTFKTRAGAKWSDGRPLTAADAAFTINTIIKYPEVSGNYTFYLEQAIAAEARDARTLVIRYKVPVANVLDNMVGIPIIPEHVWKAQIGKDGAGLTESKNFPTVTGGPFTVADFKENDFILFRRYDGFYGPKPKIDGFGLRIYTNPDAAIAALRSGEIDLVQVVPAIAYNALRRDSKIAIRETAGTMVDRLRVNLNPQRPQHRELLNRSVRTAIDLAIDRKKILNVVYAGHGRAGVTVMPPGSGRWFNAKVGPTKFDPAKANAILDGLGFKRGNDGIRRVTGTGAKMSYEYLTSGSQGGGLRPAEIVRDGLKRIGVELRIFNTDPSTQRAKLTAPDGKYLSYDFAAFTSVLLYDPQFQLGLNYGPNDARKGGLNRSIYKNAEYDRLYLAQGRERNAAKRQAIVWRMQDILYRDKPDLVLNYRTVLEASSKQWTGFVLSPQGSFNQFSKATLTNVRQTG